MLKTWFVLRNYCVSGGWGWLCYKYFFRSLQEVLNVPIQILDVLHMKKKTFSFYLQNVYFDNCRRMQVSSCAKDTVVWRLRGWRGVSGCCMNTCDRNRGFKIPAAGPQQLLVPFQWGSHNSGCIQVLWGLSNWQLLPHSSWSQGHNSYCTCIAL